MYFDIRDGLDDGRLSLLFGLYKMLVGDLGLILLEWWLIYFFGFYVVWEGDGMWGMFWYGIGEVVEFELIFWDFL